VSRPRISVLVPTRNEEQNLPGCLASVSWADEILVVDSESTDRTREVAEAHGAIVWTRAFDDFASQKNWALARLTNPWALCVDADERVDEDLARAISELPEEPVEDGFELARVNHFLGRRIRHCGWQGERVVRLFRREGARFEGRVHERLVGPRRLGRLPGSLVHFPYRTWADCQDKLWRYARLNAEQARAGGRRAGPSAMRVRPPLRFARMYVAQGGFLDGPEGLALCGLAACQVFLKYALLWDASRRPGEDGRRDGAPAEREG
jgi:glycosyltransferase involved in cell wall biosynthesis